MLLFFAFPFVSGLLLRLGSDKYWFRDFEAVACAAQRRLLDLSIYDRYPSCLGMKPLPFVYPPLAADGMAVVLRTMGPTGMTALYGAVFWPAIGFLLWAQFFGARAPGTLRERVPFLATVTTIPLMWGNVAIPLHGAVVASAILAPGATWLLAGVIAVATMITPVFVLYVIVLLYGDQPLVRRMLMAAGTALVGFAPVVWAGMTEPETVTAWISQLDGAVMRSSGNSYFAWLGVLGLDPRTLPVRGGYFIFAALLAGAGLMAVGAARPRGLDRLWFGLTVANLLNPRMKGNEMLLLGPGMVVAIAMAADYAPRVGRFFRLGLTWVCALVVVLILMGGRSGFNLASFTFSVAIIWIGALHWRRMVAQKGFWWWAR